MDVREGSGVPRDAVEQVVHGGQELASRGRAAARRTGRALRGGPPPQGAGPSAAGSLSAREAVADLGPRLAVVGAGLKIGEAAVDLSPMGIRER